MGGVASMIGNLFGGASEPEAPQYSPPPSPETKEAESEATRNAEMRKNRARAGGVRATLLTSPLGGQGQGQGQARTILGSSAGSGA